MKLSDLLPLLVVLANVAIAANIGGGWHEIQRRQGWDIFGSAAQALGTFRSGGAGKVADPPNAAPRRVELTSDFPVPGARRVKIRSGPYKVPNMGVKSLSGHSGMLEGYFDRVIEKPCEECNILRQIGGLEYANGTNANIDSGMWLHHMVMMNTGPRRWDPVGVDSTVCAPFLVTGTTASRSERYFVTGNERTPFTYYQDSPSKSAYHVDAADKFTFLVELMNMNMEDQVVYITQTYDILDGPLPEGWNDVKTVFLDVKSCLTSEAKPPSGKNNFILSSTPWTPNIEGRILDAGGHLHDGGVYVDITANPSTNSTLCRSVAKYSEKPEYIWRGAAMGDDKVARDHISSMAGCETPELRGREMKRDQSWVIKARYDFSQKEGNLENGKMAEVMGIAIVLVAVPPGKIDPIR